MVKRQHHINRFLYILGILIIFSIGFFWWITSTQPVNISSQESVTFSIEKGSGLRQVATDLHNKGLIRDVYAMLLTVKLLGIEGSVQAGEFVLSPNMDTATIARKLTKGVNDVRITIPEGKRAEEVASIIAKQIPTIDEDEWKAELIKHEGYLFPDTYNITKDTSLEKMVEIMKDNFDTKYTSLTKSSTLSDEEIVIVASMIEREARHAEDRPLVASVIYNRFTIGMKLDIDATVQYALGYNTYTRTWWKKGLSLDDLAIDSPYNTYTNAGLPPRPIANPGLASLNAAANPADTNYFYYITDGDGINHYARTLAEHNANIKKYGL